MENLTNINVIKQLLKRHGFTFSKGLGQNFLINPTVCPKMAELGGAKKGVGVIEIGAGIGVLTKELAEMATKVVCIEIDERLFPILDETLSQLDNVELVHADVMDVDINRLIGEKFKDLDVIVCANLPYYITTPIIMKLLEEKLPIQSITVMVQREAAMRICAQPGTREVGAVSLAIRYYSNPVALFHLSRGSFLPSPNVDSTVIRLDILKTPPILVKDETLYFKVIKAAFAMRRKTLLNCLAHGFSMPKEQIRSILLQSGLGENDRAEQLTIEQFATLADCLLENL